MQHNIHQLYREPLLRSKKPYKGEYQELCSQYHHQGKDHSKHLLNGGMIRGKQKEH